MKHSCPDGTATRLDRTGPVGTMAGVTFACSRCGWTDTAPAMLAKAEAALVPVMMTEVFSEEVEEGRMVEVHRDQFGEYWYGVTVLRGPKDWTFRPHAHFGTERLAIDAAKSLAEGIRFDAAWGER